MIYCRLLTIIFLLKKESSVFFKYQGISVSLHVYICHSLPALPVVQAEKLKTLRVTQAGRDLQWTSGPAFNGKGSLDDMIQHPVHQGLENPVMGTLPHPWKGCCSV